MENLKSLSLPRTTSLQKRKSKLPKPIKEIKNVEIEEEPILEMPDPKSIKKQPSKVDRRELLKEEQNKLKQQIFNDYNQVMTYKIHKESIESEKLEPESKIIRKNLSIIQNLAITIDPSRD